jgi:RHH-type rel operon transcriptional repressor/antitoxin RelB
MALEKPMLALRLPPEIEKRLDELARKTGRTKSFYAREAILEHLDDLEDLYLAEERMRSGLQFVSLEQAIGEIGLTRKDIDAASDH